MVFCSKEVPATLVVLLVLTSLAGPVTGKSILADDDQAPDTSYGGDTWSDFGLIFEVKNKIELESVIPYDSNVGDGDTVYLTEYDLSSESIGSTIDITVNTGDPVVFDGSPELEPGTYAVFKQAGRVSYSNEASFPVSHENVKLVNGMYDGGTTDQGRVFFGLKYSSAKFCSFRGLLNQCIINESKNLDEKVYNVENIFVSEIKSTFKAQNGQPFLNISNSSRISGLWRGSFKISSDNLKIRSGASFRPVGGRIILK